MVMNEALQRAIRSYEFFIQYLALLMDWPRSYLIP